MWLVALALILLGGCAGVAVNVETLQGQGYQRFPVVRPTPGGGWHEEPKYELWVQESRADKRTVRLCLVPKISGAGYHWAVTVNVENRPAWGYESGQFAGLPFIRQRIDCTVSGPLPEGPLSYGVSYVYRD